MFFLRSFYADSTIVQCSIYVRSMLILRSLNNRCHYTLIPELYISARQRNKASGKFDEIGTPWAKRASMQARVMNELNVRPTTKLVRGSLSHRNRWTDSIGKYSYLREHSRLWQSLLHSLQECSSAERKLDFERGKEKKKNLYNLEKTGARIRTLFFLIWRIYKRSRNCEKKRKSEADLHARR